MTTMWLELKSKPPHLGPGCEGAEAGKGSQGMLVVRACWFSCPLGCFFSQLSLHHRGDCQDSIFAQHSSWL